MYLHKYRHIYNFDETLQYEIGPHSGFIVGNVYTLATAGIMFRYGTHLKADIGPPAISPAFSGVPAFRPIRQSNWYLFSMLEAPAVARNIFLDGNTWRDSHSVDKRPLVADLQVGFAYHFNDIRLSFVQVFRSKEFKQQSGSTQYGTINLTFYFNFSGG